MLVGWVILKHAKANWIGSTTLKLVHTIRQSDRVAKIICQNFCKKGYRIIHGKVEAAWK